MSPQKKRENTASTPVEAIVHSDKRANLPTADAQEFVTPEVEIIQRARYPRDPSLDPQLVWAGKDEQDNGDLEADAPPIYIQEKIDPRVLVENLRRTGSAVELEPELTLFESFDGLGGLDLVDFYRHEANWSNRMILGDSLHVMASLSEREALRGKIQMIYVDPPYGIKFGSNWQVSTRNRDVRDGRIEDASREVEVIKAFRDTWTLGIHSYLTYLRDRLTVAKDLLTDSGSIFMQIGDENVHLARALMDEVFGSDNFISQIAFVKTSGLGTEGLVGAFDYLVWYGKTKQVKYRQLYLSKAVGGEGAEQYRWSESPEGVRTRLTAGEAAPMDARVFRMDNATSALTTPHLALPVEFDGRVFSPPRNAQWKTTQDGMRRLRVARRLHAVGNTLSYVRYIDDFPVFKLNNFWDDTAISGFGDPRVYVVQTNTKVVQRCVLMTTDPGDLVLDPTCGSGTTAYVAEQWGRRWITIDSSRVALALARQRLMAAKFPYYLLADSQSGRRKEEDLVGEVLPAADTRDDIRRGFVVERIPHIMLSTIAKNPDIVEGMSRDAIAASIKRHADYEMLVDKPYEDAKKVRVSGPFTVESLSPHRSLAFVASDSQAMPASEEQAVRDLSSPTFEQTIMENLRKAGIQNGKRKERLEFDLLEPYAGVFIQAVGTREGATNGAARVGIAIGPQYGTVGAPYIKDAAREAIRARDIDLLCVLGFAFDPLALGASDDYIAEKEGFANVAAERSLGRVPVLLVRMNADLVMGTELKKTGAGNLFMVFGEPDIVIKRFGTDVVVHLLGVDVYDPTTGEVRNNSTEQIALWMIDTNYNQESFFVRHCYFTGGQDPYRRLKAALNAEIDEVAWASLYRTESRPFAKPETGKIAVKVINDYGDEVVKIFII